MKDLWKGILSLLAGSQRLPLAVAKLDALHRGELETGTARREVALNDRNEWRRGKPEVQGDPDPRHDGSLLTTGTFHPSYAHSPGNGKRGPS